jgi:hypothetical protein
MQEKGNKNSLWFEVYGLWFFKFGQSFSLQNSRFEYLGFRLK